ncbi:hypothetical protein CLU79DRAFT_761667 [Phycomyces nitens]|nr:hypothetical protein CLU79DRAFT_761667 [Phycomyces nitens]
MLQWRFRGWWLWCCSSWLATQSQSLGNQQVRRRNCNLETVGRRCPDPASLPNTTLTETVNPKINNHMYNVYIYI